MVESKLNRKNWLLVAIVLVPIVMLPLAMILGATGIVQLSLQDGQPTLLGLLTDYSIGWTVAVTPFLLFVYFVGTYLGTKESYLIIKMTVLGCAEFVLYLGAWLLVANGVLAISYSVFWFYLCAPLTFFLGQILMRWQSSSGETFPLRTDAPKAS